MSSPAASDSLTPMEHVGNMTVNWKRYKRRFTRFVDAYHDRASDKRKVAILLNGVGDAANDVFVSFNLKPEEQEVLATVLQKFDGYYIPQNTLTYRRHAFFTRKQQRSESYEEYMATLKNLSNVCNFDTLADGIVRDIFICGILDKGVQVKLLELGDITSDKVLEAARNTSSGKRVLRVKTEVKAESLDLLKKNSPSTSETATNHSSSSKGSDEDTSKPYPSQKSEQPQLCKFCGYKHFKGCPAFGKECTSCGELNHFSRMCTAEKRIDELSRLADHEGFQMDIIHIDEIESTPEPGPGKFEANWYSVDLQIEGLEATFKEVVQQSEDDQDGSETSNHTIALPGTAGHEVLLLHCDPKQKDDGPEGPTILGPIQPDDDDERTTIHMEEFLKLKCSDINKNHSEEEEFHIMFETKVRRMENGELTKATFQCDTCTKTFKRKEHLYQHKKLHTGERPFKCAHCVRTFSRKEHLVRHAHSHTGQKLFNCDVCGKSFSRKDNVRKHRKTHETTGPYSCDACGMQFNVRPYYIMHKNKHKDGSCANEVTKSAEGEESITYEVQEESPDVHSNESNSFQQVTSSTSTSILEKALKQEG